MRIRKSIGRGLVAALYLGLFLFVDVGRSSTPRTYARLTSPASPAPVNLLVPPLPGSRRVQLPYRQDRILVRPKQSAAPEQLSLLHAKLGHRVAHSFAHIGNLQVVVLRKGADVVTEIKAYLASGLVAYAEPDYEVSVLQSPSDFFYQQGNQWGLFNTGIYGGTPGADIDAPDGWNVRTDASSIIVAIVDTGLRLTHEDLAGNLWVNSGEFGVDARGNGQATNGIDDDGDGYIDDIHGINALTASGDPTDDYGHGSNVAGIVGAVGNNGVGITGVCWRVQLMALKSLDSQGHGTISDAITCLDYARSKGAKIVNASWGSYTFTSSALMDAVNSLRDAGIIFVAACGNDGNNNDVNSLFPASYNYDNVIAVAATDRNDNLASFSNYGAATVHLAAPGEPVFSCWNGSDSDYQYDQGTSQAAPFVTGACALVWAQYPALTPAQVISRVLGGVDLLPGLAGKCITGGRLNLAHALQAQPDPVVPAQTIWIDDALPSGAISDVPGGGSDSWTNEPWTWINSNPTPYSGTAAHQSALASGIHMHYFSSAAPMSVYPGDTLFAYVYLDPTNPPTEIMLSWQDSCWEHRAYWGQNAIDWGANGTSDRRYMGPLPALGQWVRLSVPASSMMLEGATLQGMNFMLMNGKATFDCAGRFAAGSPAP